MLDYLSVFGKEANVTAFSGYLIIAALILSAVLPFVRGKLRSSCRFALVLVCTIVTALFFAHMLQPEGKKAPLQLQASEERAEWSLRIVTAMNVGIARLYQSFTPISDDKGKLHQALELSNTGMSPSFKIAETSLKDAIAHNPGRAELKAKLAVLLAVSGGHHSLEKSVLSELKNSKVESEKQLGEVLEEILLQKPQKSSAESASRLKTIVSAIPQGWYRDNAVLRLYRFCKEGKEYAAFARELEDRYFRSFCLTVSSFLFVGLAAFIGVVVIVIQLGSLGRSDPPVLEDSEKMGLDLSLRSVFEVFVGWITSQMAIAALLKILPGNVLSMGGSALGAACFALVSYVVEMLPVLVLIYLIALRPNGLNPFTALKLRWRTPTLGPIRLVLSGVLAWCAIVPLVFAGAAAAFASGSQGSDNPILPQIALIASSSNTVAILLMLTTVAVLAPFAEEIVFRGFLYSVLRKRIGIFPGIVVSALIFAGIHFDRGGTFMLLALGPVLAMAYERTRSLYPSMIAHGLWNSGAFALLLSLYSS